MTTEKKTISGTISDIAFKSTKNDEEYVEVSLMQPGQQYATKCRAFDEELVTRFHNAKKGTLIGLAIEESPGTYQGKSITYRNIIGITAAEKREAFPEDTEALRTARAGQKLPAKPDDPPDSQAERERSTNRRTALMQAVAYNPEYTVEGVLTVASDFDRWLNHEMPPSVAKEEPPPDPNPMSEEESPF